MSKELDLTKICVVRMIGLVPSAEMNYEFAIKVLSAACLFKQNFNSVNDGSNWTCLNSPKTLNFTPFQCFNLKFNLIISSSIRLGPASILIAVPAGSSPNRDLNLQAYSKDHEVSSLDLLMAHSATYSTVHDDELGSVYVIE
jgi:hypothetical protein